MLQAIVLLSAARLGADRLHVERRRSARPWRCGSTTGSADVWIGLVALGIPLLFPDGRLAVTALAAPRPWLAAGCFALGDPRRGRSATACSTRRRPGRPNPYALPGAAGDACAAVASASGALYAVAALIGLAGLVVAACAAPAGSSASSSSGSPTSACSCSPPCCCPPISLLDDRSATSLGASAWSGVPRPRHLRPAARHRHRDPAPPAVRHRRRHQPHAGLRRADGHARRHLPRRWCC